MNHTRNRIVILLAGLALAIGFLGAAHNRHLRWRCTAAREERPTRLRCATSTRTPFKSRTGCTKTLGTPRRTSRSKYKVVDLNTGKVSYTNVLTTRVTTTATIMYSGILRTSGRFQIYHSARFGTARDPAGRPGHRSTQHHWPVE